jgi:hypothetical protein
MLKLKAGNRYAYGGNERTELTTANNKKSRNWKEEPYMVDFFSRLSYRVVKYQPYVRHKFKKSRQ